MTGGWWVYGSGSGPLFRDDGAMDMTRKYEAALRLQLPKDFQSQFLERTERFFVIIPQSKSIEIPSGNDLHNYMENGPVELLSKNIAVVNSELLVITKLGSFQN